MIIGIIREGKNPPDKRVPLIPEQCKSVQDSFGCKVLVQPSEVRAYTDDEYKILGIEVKEDLSECDILLGVKEVPLDMLMPGKTYFFFSHTFKKQPYNRGLLKTILKKNIRLVDYEVLTNIEGQRLVAFGRYAGIVGAYNALRGYGDLKNFYHLKPAHLCHDRKEMNAELVKLNLPKNLKIAITGKGRVAKGAIETLHAAAIKQVSPQEYLSEEFNEPVFADLAVTQYNITKDGSDFSKSAFFKNPGLFKSNFARFARVTDIYIAAHYWDSKAPFIFSRQEAKDPDFKIKLVADISCDIDGPVASTLRPSTIANPYYGYDPIEEKETEFGAKDSIGVMAVDNLPCELPRDSSVDFGHDLIKNVLPHLFDEDVEEVIWRATETIDGKLTPHFSYLQDYVNGSE